MLTRIRRSCLSSPSDRFEWVSRWTTAGVTEPSKTRDRNERLSCRTHASREIFARYRYRLPSALYASAPLPTRRVSIVLTVCGCQSRSTASRSATSLAATGSWSQTTFITSHSASEIPGALAISQPFRLQLWLEYDYGCGWLSREICRP